MKPEDEINMGQQVQGTAIMLGEYLAQHNVPTHIGMAALAMALASTAKITGMTPHEAVDRFISSVKAVYRELEK